MKNQLLYCLDAGHFHPTENLANKISLVLQFVPELLLHVGRGAAGIAITWSSLMIPRGALKALLSALLEPAGRLREAEQAGDNTLRLTLFEESRTLPLGAVWDEYCRRQDVPAGPQWMEEVKTYERAVLASRQAEKARKSWA